MLSSTYYESIRNDTFVFGPTFILFTLLSFKNAVQMRPPFQMKADVFPEFLSSIREKVSYFSGGADVTTRNTCAFGG